MAGSPGAGKTEFVKELKELDTRGELGTPNSFAVIDPDAIRDYLPGYTGDNSHLFQNAISIGTSALFRSVLKNHQNAIVDGTMANYKYATSNIQKVIESGVRAAIFYIFQHPSIARDFTQKREAVEGRRITKPSFIDKFIGAKDTVNSIKQEFGDKIYVNVVIKDYKDSIHNKAIEKVFIDVNEMFRFRYIEDGSRIYLGGSDAW